MKKKVMYVKPFTEKVYMEIDSHLVGGTTNGAGGAGGANNGGTGGGPDPGFNDAKSFVWDDDLDGGSSDDNTSKTTFAWDDFKRR